MGKQLFCLISMLILVLDFGSFISAEVTDEFNNQMIEKTKDAAELQLLLSERGFTVSEVNELLKPYFTENFIHSFISINMVQENDNLYYVIGTDFPIFYIPFFKYEGETIVEADQDSVQMIVYEFFPASSDGPVGYDDHFEAVIYRLENDEWKVAEIIPQYNPEAVSVKEQEKVKSVIASKQPASLTDLAETKESKAEEVEKSETLVEKGRNILLAIKSFFSSIFGMIFFIN